MRRARVVRQVFFGAHTHMRECLPPLAYSITRYKVFSVSITSNNLTGRGERERHTDRETDRCRDRERDRWRETETDRWRETEREMDGDRRRETYG